MHNNVCKYFSKNRNILKIIKRILQIGMTDLQNTTDIVQITITYCT